MNHGGGDAGRNRPGAWILFRRRTAKAIARGAQARGCRLSSGIEDQLDFDDCRFRRRRKFPLGDRSLGRGGQAVVPADHFGAFDAAVGADGDFQAHRAADLKAAKYGWVFRFDALDDFAVGILCAADRSASDEQRTANREP